MAFSYTALQLLNRVRRLRRLDDVASIAKTEDLAALDAINTAIEEVLSSDRWEFDLRKAQLTLHAAKDENGTASATAGVDLYSYVNTTDGVVAADVYGDYIVRLIPTESSNYGATAIRILSGTHSSSTSASLYPSIDAPEDYTTSDATLIYAEYILPETVRDIVRVCHQERPLTLEQIDPVIEFDELYPRPSLEFGQPETISVGGLDISTYENGTTEPDPGLRMIVWPVPDQDYVIDYTYYYRHPELSASTDTLDGVPQNVVAKIVETAAAQMKAFYEKDYNALNLKNDARRSLADMHRRSKGQSADRKIMGNWEGTGSRQRQFGSLTGGRLIGGG